MKWWKVLPKSQLGNNYECLRCKDFGWIISKKKIITCPVCKGIHKPKE